MKRVYTPRMSAERVRELAAQVAAGKSVAQVAREAGVKQRALARRLRRMGVVPKPQRRPGLDPDAGPTRKFRRLYLRLSPAAWSALDALKEATGLPAVAVVESALVEWARRSLQWEDGR